MQDYNKKVVVIGAGLAGLTTAYRLQQSNLDVHVYEARSRVGGRILSAFMNNDRIEIGAENIADGGSADNLRQLADELGLEIETSTKQYLDHFFYHNGVLHDAHKLVLEYQLDEATLLERLTLLQKSCSSMRDVLEKLFPGNTALHDYFDTRLAVFEGDSIDQLSSLYIETLYHMLKGKLCSVHELTNILCPSIKGGNSSLPVALAQKVAPTLHLNMPVTAIVKDEHNNYRITFADCSTTTADILVLAIPCSTYKNIMFGEGVIPADRLAGIRSIPYGQNAKILVPKSPNYPDTTIFVGKDLGIYTFHETAITFYFVTQASRFEQNSVQKIYQDALPLLASVPEVTVLQQQQPALARDELFARYDGAVGHSWPRDPYAGGSYSYIGAGQEALFTDLQDYHGISVKKLFAPIGNLYFTGEHTSTLYDVPGTMEAACQAGNLTARLIQVSTD